MKIPSYYTHWPKINKCFNTSLAAPGALAHRLQRRNACNAVPPAKSKMAASGPPNGQRGLSNFC